MTTICTHKITRRFQDFLYVVHYTVLRPVFLSIKIQSNGSCSRTFLVVLAIVKYGKKNDEHVLIRVSVACRIPDFEALDLQGHVFCCNGNRLRFWCGGELLRSHWTGTDSSSQNNQDYNKEE